MWDKDKKEIGSRPSESSRPGYSQDAVKGGRIVNIGPSIHIKGELKGDEDLTIDGRVEGKIELREHNLTIGANGKIKADLYAKTIIIAGEVGGNAFASERVELTPTGRLNGDIASPRITIADGAHFKGSVDMERGAADAAHRPGARADEMKAIPTAKDVASVKQAPRV